MTRAPTDGDQIRATFLRFPRWTQPLWTLWTGRALPGERPWFVPSPWAYLALALAALVVGVALGAFLVATCWPLLPVAWLIAVGASRTLVSTIAHQCVHYRFTGDRRTDMRVADALSILTFTKAAPLYRLEHTLQHHHGELFTTERDPSAKFLVTCGLLPGRSCRRAAIQLALNVVSPAFHARFLWGRVRGDFVDVSWARLILAGAVWGAAAIAIIATGTGATFALAYAVPVICLYHVSVMLEFASEHAWLVPRAKTTAATWGRFCGSPVPTGGFGPWLAWIGAMLGHLVVRIGVLPADLPQHDFHHRFPGTRRWTHAAHARTDAVARGAPLVEVWGLHHALAHVLRGLEERRHA